MRARKDRETRAHLPQGTLVAIAGGKQVTDVAAVIARLDKAKAKYADIILVHGGGPGIERIAAQWAERNGVHQVVCKPDWNAHGRAAPFRRNDELLNLLPKGVIAFPGSGITDNLVDKAVKRSASRCSGWPHSGRIATTGRVASAARSPFLPAASSTAATAFASRVAWQAPRSAAAPPLFPGTTACSRRDTIARASVFTDVATLGDTDRLSVLSPTSPMLPPMSMLLLVTVTAIQTAMMQPVIADGADAVAVLAVPMMLMRAGIPVREGWARRFATGLPCRARCAVSTLRAGIPRASVR